MHRLGAQQREELLIGIEPTKRIDDKGQPGLRQVGFLDQQALALRFGLIALDQRRGSDLPGIGNASAGPRWALSPLVALQNDPPNGQDLITRQQFVLVSLGKRLLDIVIRSAGNFHGDISRHDATLDGGEEPEIVGIYLIDDAGAPVRIGFALGNEFSDHITERQNYLWLAHSKLRPASVGPELLVGDLPADINGMSRIRRGKEIIWEKPFLSGEQNMAHSIANLEAHHFKYGLFRRPGDVHVHFFGTATLSFSDGVKTQKGDVFEIESETFGLPLRNRLSVEKAAKARVRAL